MNITRTIRSVVVATSLVASALVSGTAAATPNTSSYSMQLSGNTINVYETNSELVNAAQADFTYTGSTSSFSITAGVGSTFPTCLSQSSASVSCAILGGSASVGAAHLVASLTFAPNTGVTSGSVKVTMANSSQVLATADSTDTLNHATLPSITYSFAAPVQTAPSAPVTGSGSKTTTTGTKTTTTTPTAPTTTKTTTSSSNKNDKNSQKNNKHQAPAPQPKHIKSHHTGVVTSTVSALIILVAAAYWLVIRKRPEFAPAKIYKLHTTTKTAPAKKTKITSNKTAATAARKPATKKVATKKTVARKATTKKKA